MVKTIITILAIVSAIIAILVFFTNKPSIFHFFVPPKECSLSIEEINSFKSKVFVKTGFFRNNPVTEVDKFKQEFKELIDFIDNHPNCKKEVTRELAMLYRVYGASIILSGSDNRVSPNYYLRKAFPYIEKSYKLSPDIWSKSNEKESYNYLKKIVNSSESELSLKEYFRAIFTIAMMTAPVDEINKIVDILIDDMLVPLVGKPKTDLEYFYSFPRKENNYKSYIFALKTLAEGNDGTLGGPIFSSNNDNTTIIRYILKGKTNRQGELIWIVDKGKKIVEPKTELAKSMHNLLLKDNPDIAGELKKQFKIEKEISSIPPKSQEIIKDGIGILGVLIDQSTVNEVISKFGNDYEVINHKNYSIEYKYNKMGLSFFHKYDDPVKKIFSINAFYPFLGRTLKGIELGNSLASDVIKNYGKAKWTTTMEGNTWYLCYPGINFYVEKDNTSARNPNFDYIYENKKIIKIAIRKS